MGALPFVLRELGHTPPIYGGPLTAAMVRSKLDEHRLKDVSVTDVLATQTFDAGPFSVEMVKMAHSIPDSFAVALTCELGTTLVTGDYKFDQTPVDGVPADVSRLAELGREGLLLLCGDSTNADRPGMSPSESSVGPRLREVFSRCEGRIVVTCFASNIHRVQQVVDAAAVLDRRVSLVGRSMRKNVNIGRMLGHIDVPEGMLVGPKEIEDFPDSKLVVISTGSQGEPLSRAAAHGPRRPPPGGAPRRRHRDLLGHTDPRERAGRERDDRPHLSPRRRRDHPARRGGARLRPRLRRGAQAHAQPDQAPIRAAHPRRPPAPAPAQRAGRGGGRPAEVDLPRRERATARNRRLGRRLRRAGAGGHDLRGRRRRGRHRGRGPARPPDALGGRHLHRRRHDLGAGRPLRRPARDHLPRSALRGRVRRVRGGAARGGRRLAGHARPTRRSGRSTSCRTICTTTWPSSCTSACAGGR